MMRSKLWITCLVLAAVATQVKAQSQKALRVDEALARNINGTPEQQNRPFPHKVVGNVYHVGSETLSSFLITTPAGHILINSTYERNVPLIRSSVEQLGFRFADIRILLGSHAHTDHHEGDALVKELSGAQVMVMAEDVPLVQEMRPGGKAHPVDRVLHHLDTVQLGGTTLTAHLTPGHTPGCTTWTWKAEEGGRSYDVLLLCGGGPTPQGGALVDANGKLTKVSTDFMSSQKYLRKLPLDVFLAAHGTMYNVVAKAANIGKGPNPFIDPEGYLNELENWEKFFMSRLEEQAKKAISGTGEKSSDVR
jgi:metallo-beta-lactamase class B